MNETQSPITIPFHAALDDYLQATWGAAGVEKERKALITAADSYDDLLNALKGCILELSQIHRHYQPDCLDGCPTHEVINLAHAAIAKAERREGSDHGMFVIA